MRILFNGKSAMIDTHMSDSNIGGQKDKSGINHIWVLTGIIHEQLSSVKNQPIVVQQYDYAQMFDGMHLKEAGAIDAFIVSQAEGSSVKTTSA